MFDVGICICAKVCVFVCVRKKEGGGGGYETVKRVSATIVGQGERERERERKMGGQEEKEERGGDRGELAGHQSESQASHTLPTPLGSQHAL